MITNDRIQSLIAADREALVFLMAVAYSNGQQCGGLFDIWLDPDIRALLDAARGACVMPQNLVSELRRWNREMGAL